MGGDALSLFEKLCGGALLLAVIGTVLSEVSKSARIPVRMSGTVFLYGGVMALFLPLIARITELTAGHMTGVSAPYGTIALKCLGIALTSEIVATLCRESGEGGMAQMVELAGKALILLLFLPTVEMLLETVGGLLSM